MNVVKVDRSSWKCLNLNYRNNVIAFPVNTRPIMLCSKTPMSLVQEITLTVKRMVQCWFLNSFPGFIFGTKSKKTSVLQCCCIEGKKESITESELLEDVTCTTN